MEINVLDLFSGIGGFHLGLERAGFKVNSYFSEIDKYAIDVYSNNFKTATYVGSVTDVRSEQLPKIDVITFGSPCQDFSLAGKRKGLEGSRSSLIGEAIRLISECRPSFFIWENVKGTFSSNDGADFWAIIQAFTNIGGYRLEWQLLNTKWFLPQNRERIYLVGYLGGRSGQQVFPIGKSNEFFNSLAKERQTSACICAGYHKGLNYDNQLIKVYDDYNSKFRDDDNIGTMTCNIGSKAERNGQKLVIQVNSATSKGYEEATTGDSINLSVPTSKTRRGRVGKGVAQTLDTHCNQAVIPGTWRTHIDGQGFREVQDGNCPTIPARAREDGSGQPVVKIGDYRSDEGYRERKDGDSPTLNANNTHSETGGTPILVNLETNYTYKKVNETIEKNPNSFIQDQPKMMDLHNRSIHDDSPCLVEPHQNNSSLFNGSRIRRLTPIECERLQGFPDNWTAIGKTMGEISDTQRYKMCGNAVTVDVVAAVAHNIRKLYL